MHQVAPLAASACGSGCEPPTSTTSTVPAVSSPACRAAVTCSGVHTSAPTNANPSSPCRRTRRGPAPRPTRPAIQIGTRGRLHTGLRRHATARTGHRVAGEHRHEQLDPGVERGAASAVVRRRLAERRVLAVAVDAEAEAEHHPARRQAVERRRCLSDELRPPPRQRRHQRADQHPLGRHRDRRQRDERVGERGQRAVPQVVPHEHAVPPGLLGGRPPPRRPHPGPPAPRTARSTGPIARRDRN